MGSAFHYPKHKRGILFSLIFELIVLVFPNCLLTGKGGGGGELYTVTYVWVIYCVPKGSITNQFIKTQNTLFLQTQTNIIYQNTNKFTKPQINFPKHKSVYQNTPTKILYYSFKIFPHF